LRSMPPPPPRAVGKLVVKTAQNKDLPTTGFRRLNSRSILLLFAAIWSLGKTIWGKKKKLQAKTLEKCFETIWIMLDTAPRTPKCSLNFTRTALCPVSSPQYKPSLFRKLEKVS